METRILLNSNIFLITSLEKKNKIFHLNVDLSFCFYCCHALLSLLPNYDFSFIDVLVQFCFFVFLAGEGGFLCLGQLIDGPFVTAISLFFSSRAT